MFLARDDRSGFQGWLPRMASRVTSKSGFQNVFQEMLPPEVNIQLTRSENVVPIASPAPKLHIQLEEGAR